MLDTHAFLWLVTDDPRLSATAKAVFLEDDNELLLSAVTGFEIAVKYWSLPGHSSTSAYKPMP